MSSGRVWASPPSNICNLISSSSKAQTRKRWSFPVIIHRLPTEHNRRLCSSDLNLNNSIKFAVTTTPLHTSSFRCNSSSIPGGPGPRPGPGESDSRSVLDAFFLGKALAEAVNERIESAVGEFLSTVGRLQAEQQKQVQDFQEEVLERAKRAKEKAAREAMEAQGFIPKPSTENVSVNGDGDSTTSITPATNTPAIPTSSYNSNASDVNTDPGPSEEDPIFGVPIED